MKKVIIIMSLALMVACHKEEPVIPVTGYWEGQMQTMGSYPAVFPEVTFYLEQIDNQLSGYVSGVDYGSYRYTVIGEIVNDSIYLSFVAPVGGQLYRLQGKVGPSLMSMQGKYDWNLPMQNTKRYGSFYLNRRK